MLQLPSSCRIFDLQSHRPVWGVILHLHGCGLRYTTESSLGEPEPWDQWKLAYIAIHKSMAFARHSSTRDSEADHTRTRKTMSAVIIRFAQYADLPAIGRVMGQAFFDDSLFGEIIHPHRQRYPEDVNLYWLRRAYADYWNYRWRWLVAVVKEPATGKDVVVGVAAWERLGSGGETMECASYDPRKRYASTLIALGSFQS
jgi:hypothetical protein